MSTVHITQYSPALAALDIRRLLPRHVFRGRGPRGMPGGSVGKVRSRETGLVRQGAHSVYVSV